MIEHEKTWSLLRKGKLKRENEYLLKAAQNNAIRTNYFDANIDKTQQNSEYRLCEDRDETVKHNCCKLAQKEYNTKHNKVGKVVPGKLRKRL